MQNIIISFICLIIFTILYLLTCSKEEVRRIVDHLCLSFLSLYVPIVLMMVHEDARILIYTEYEYIWWINLIAVIFFLIRHYWYKKKF